MNPKLLQKKEVTVAKLLLKITIPLPLRFFYELMQKEILANGVPNCYRKLVPDKRCGEAVAR
jgi:hypothetical protein